MRVLRRMGLALLMALALSVPVSAQSFDERLSFDAAVGPSFATLGTTWSTTAGLSMKVNDRTWLVGEIGMLPHAPFADAAYIAPPAPQPAESPRVNAYHVNANVKVQPVRALRHGRPGFVHR